MNRNLKILLNIMPIDWSMINYMAKLRRLSSVGGIHFESCACCKEIKRFVKERKSRI
jgi:hypothetical protein